MSHIHKSVALSLLMALTVLPSWQVAEAADGVRGRHSLIHRPQIRPAPAIKPAPSPPQSQLHSSPPSLPVHRKVVRRPVAAASPRVEVAPITPTDSEQADSSPTSHKFYNPDDAPPEAEMASPPEPQVPPNAEAQ